MDGMKNVVITRPEALLPALAEELLDAGAVPLPADASAREAFLAQRGDEFTIAVSAVAAGVDAALMNALPNLELVANFGVGYDSTDVEAASERGVTVSNTPDVLNDCVADLAIGLLIDVMRGMSASDRFAREGRWPAGPFPLMRRVTGTKVGILGLGRIGMEIAKRLEGFRCEIGYHNRSERTDVEYGYFESLEGLAEWADALIVATPGGRETRALVDERVLRALGAGGFLVNIARGSVIDEDALIRAVENREIAGAGLDVYTHEPEIPQALREMDSVVITPHTASGTVETRRAMADVVLANVHAWQRDGEAVTPVN